MVVERQSGHQTTYAEGTDDLLNILLSSDFYKNEIDLLVQEIMTFFLAGFLTV
jgi:hypothetical protein